jgi:alkanesulfonate monooxygenase SsuD/methylene tetrahydromethanopterin reductase-like flavin-dependent oxidoreductase (luciferase family)
MITVTLRYDMRVPDGGVPPETLYATALDQCEWADKLGLYEISLMEHHATDDGYLPSPIVLGSAVAARTQKILVSFAVILLPLYDPIRLAEDLAVLDLIAKGRVRLIFGAGYRPEEFALFGLELRQRPRLMEEGIVTLKQAWTGEPFTYRGQTVRVLPRPFQKGGPRITMGGASPASAQRAARIADNYIPVADALYDIYLAELAKLGKPKPHEPRRGNTDGVMFLQVSEDPDRDWPRLGPYLLHDMNEYGKWLRAQAVNAGFKEMSSIEELRASGRFLILTPEEAVAYARRTGQLNLRPLCGGMDPALSWQGLRLFEEKVLPKLG